MTTYIIDAMHIPATHTDNHPGWACRSISPHYATRHHQRWIGTYFTLTEAEAAYNVLRQDRSCISAALLTWAPGSLAGGPRTILQHGDFASRGCTGGIPTQTLLRHGDRTWVQYSAAKCVSYTMDDWQDYEGNALNITTQPAPGHRLSARDRMVG